MLWGPLLAEKIWLCSPDAFIHTLDIQSQFPLQGLARTEHWASTGRQTCTCISSASSAWVCVKEPLLVGAVVH